jgi:hypothetical protein
VYKLFHQDQFLFQASERSIVLDFMSKHIANVLKFKSYYQRWTELEDGSTMIDYGSHTQFYYIRED